MKTSTIVILTAGFIVLAWFVEEILLRTLGRW